MGVGAREWVGERGSVIVKVGAEAGAVIMEGCSP